MKVTVEVELELKEGPQQDTMAVREVLLEAIDELDVWVQDTDHDDESNYAVKNSVVV